MMPNSTFKLKSKNALITGGGSGIGQAISELFAQHGATVHILDLNAEGAFQTKELIEKSGGKCEVHVCDICKQESVNSVVHHIAQVDILVNNAGIAHVGNLENCTANDFDRVYEVNVKGAYHVLFAVIPLMKAQGGGAILNLASIASHVGLADRFAYSVSKGAIFAMSLSLAKDYLPYNIRSNSISPARVHTPFVDGFIAKNYPGQETEMFDKLSKTQPIGRMAKPMEIANLALFLCSDEASFITGNDYPIDGGFITLNN